MNDRYVGDVGDFSKLGLLRLLLRCATEQGLDATCAVLWWATQEAGGSKGDGRHLGYLDDPTFMAADPELLLGLRRVVQQARKLRTLEEASLLQRARFHGRPIDAHEPLTAKERSVQRAVWLDEVLTVASGAPFLFVDPDNGLASRRMRPGQRAARKSVFLDELRRVTQPDQTLVLYHHATRQGSSAEQAERLRVELASAFPDHAAPVVLRAPRVSLRFYVVVPAQPHLELIRKVLAALRARVWAPILQEVA